MMKASSKLTALAIGLSTFMAGSAFAADITVGITGGPLPEVVGALSKAFENATGNKVILKPVAANQVAAQVKDGAFDALVSDEAAVNTLVKDGALSSGSRIMLSKVGLAVKAGAAKPKIATADDLKAALASAKSVAYSQGASGQHFVTVIDRLGLTDALKSKSVVVQGRPVGAAVAAGEAEIGIQQVAELMPVPGVDLVGALPGDVNKIIPYSAGVAAKAKDQGTAKAFVQFLSSESAVSLLKQKGMDPG